MGTVREQEPTQRVSNSELRADIRYINELVRRVEESLESRIDTMTLRLKSSEKTISSKIDNHLDYHKQLILTAKELADRRLKVYALFISVIAITVTILIAVLR